MVRGVLSWLLFRWEKARMRWQGTVWGSLTIGHGGRFGEGGVCCGLDHMLSPACSCHANEPHHFNTFGQCVSWALCLLVCEGVSVLFVRRCMCSVCVWTCSRLLCCHIPGLWPFPPTVTLLSYCTVPSSLQVNLHLNALTHNNTNAHTMWKLTVNSEYVTSRIL